MKNILFFFFCLLPQLVLMAQPLSKEQTEALDSLVLADVRAGSPGLAVGIVRHGQVIYERYAGLANLKDSIAIDESTRFNLASDGKQFTALCVLQLLAAGKLQLEDDFRQYLPGYLPDVKEPITIVQLLNHSSGIRDVYHLWSLQGITWWKQTLNNQDALQLLAQQQELNFPPGSRHLYSNSNYILLTELIARVSGMSFEAYSRQLFDQLGLESTAFESDHRDIANMALPYFSFDSWYGYDWLSDIVGDGALFSTLPDQLRWEVVLQNGKTKALSPQTLQLSQNPIPYTPTTYPPITNYGFGLEFGEHRDIPYRFHGGSTGAWKASTLRFPEQGLSIFVATNSGAIYPPHLSRHCADVMLGLEPRLQNQFPTGPESPGTPLPRDELLGTYRTESGFYFRVVEREGEWWLQRFGRDDIKMVKEADNLYHQADDPAFKQSFTFHPEQGYQLTAYYPRQEPYTLTQLAVDWEGYDFASLNGNFHNGETGVSFEVQRQAEDRYLILAGEQELSAQMFAPDVLLIDGFRVDVIRDEAGQVAQLMLFDSRLQGVRFVRSGD